MNCFIALLQIKMFLDYSKNIHGSLIFFKDFIYLFLERGEGKEKEKERNINV